MKPFFPPTLSQDLTASMLGFPSIQRRHIVPFCVIVGVHILLGVLLFGTHATPTTPLSTSTVISLLPSTTTTPKSIEKQTLAPTPPKKVETTKQEAKPITNTPPPTNAPSLAPLPANSSPSTSVAAAGTPTPANSEEGAASAPRFDAAYLNNPTPRYPPISRRMGEEGRVLLQVNVGVDGLPIAVSIAKTSGSERLDNAAMNAVWKWKFVAAQQSGRPIAATVNVPIVFKLD